MLGAVRQVGLDLGTANTIIYGASQGILLEEPSVVAVDHTTKQVVAIGSEARRMLGRTPGNIVALRPLREGVIANYQLTEAMIRFFLKQIKSGFRWGKPVVMVCVPSGITGVEKRAVLDATIQAGARSAYVIEEPMAAALGAGIDIMQPCGHLVVDVGGGTTDVALLSLGGIVMSESIRTAGDSFDDAIIRYIRQNFNVIIGERSAETLKQHLATANPDSRNDTYDVRGRDFVSGLPRNLRMTAGQVYEALSDVLEEILTLVVSVLERTPPELAVDVIEKGIMLTGGGAMLRDFSTFLQSRTGVPVHVPKVPLNCVAVGTSVAFHHLDQLALLKR